MIEQLIVWIVFVHVRVIDLTRLVVDCHMQIATRLIFAVVSLASIVQTIFVVNLARADGFAIYSHAIVIWGINGIGRTFVATELEAQDSAGDSELEARMKAVR